MGTRRYLALVAAPALVGILATGGVGAQAGASGARARASQARQQPPSRTHLEVRLTSSRVLVRLAATRQHRVVFVLDGHRVALKRQRPYRIAMSRARLADRSRHRIVARDAHTGVRLAARILSFGPRSIGRQPTVVITSGPGATTSATAVTIGWSSTSATSIACSVDGAQGTACTSPASLSAAAGAHTFAVTVSNRWGSASASTAFTVVPPPPPADGGAGGGGGTGGGSGPATTPPVVAPPAPPAKYSVPAGATYVSSSAQLVSALQGTNRDIVLADGVYASDAPFLDNGGNSLYAQNLGGAVLQAGLVVGGNFGSGGAVVQGIRFDVADARRTLGGGELHIWGAAGANTKVLDCLFNGNFAVPVGILAYNPQGLRIERVQLSSFTDEGIRASDNVQVAYGSSVPRMDVIQDVSIDGVSRSVPGASNGTAEAGLWVGEPVVNGVHRIRVRDAAWSGIETVNNSWDTTFTDLDLGLGGSRQAQGVGVYLEHYSRNLTFDRFTLTGVRVGFNAEWADPAYGSIAAAHFVKIQNGVIDSTGSSLPGNQAGIYLDEGTESTTVSGVTFRNQNWAGIGAYKTIGTNSFTQLTSNLAPSAALVATTHI